MAKTILIFSDGTGQIGGLRPDQRLSNVYKMFRAMRPGPDSPIAPKEQVAFYEAGLGAGETGGLTFDRMRNFFAVSLGTGIDDNVIDCYTAIIARYEPGDRIILIGFSRGAYTVRSVANVMNLCGIPSTMPDGCPVPVYGPALRKIASDAVKFVYNHGAGKKREAYEGEREIKAQRFRDKYGCDGIGAGGERQGNVQPTFVGVFDTVAALSSKTATTLTSVVVVILAALWIVSIVFWPLWITAVLTVPLLVVVYWFCTVMSGQWKYFYEDPDRRPNWWNPFEWPSIWRHGHYAVWSKANYDRYLDREVEYARHALSIDEARKDFPRVLWGREVDFLWNESRNPHWMRQVWFAGNHSDVGGSYPENESRLSDITLRWMVEQLREAIPQLQVRDEILVSSPDPEGLQHDEIQAVLDMQPAWLRRLTGDRLTWSRTSRNISADATLHSSVLERLGAPCVPQMGSVRPYRPEALRHHERASSYFENAEAKTEPAVATDG